MFTRIGGFSPPTPIPVSADLEDVETQRTVISQHLVEVGNTAAVHHGSSQIGRAVAKAAEPDNALRFSDQERIPVPKNIHYIWIGGNPISDKNYTNILRTAEIHPDCQVFIYLDSVKPLSADQLQKESGFSSGRLAKMPSNVLLVDVRSAEIFEEFKAHRGFKFYRNLCQANQNSVAADMLRCQAVKNAGGLYVDVDDKITQKIDWALLAAAPDKVLTGFTMSLGGEDKPFINNSPFAAHKGSRLVDLIYEESVRRIEEKIKKAEDSGYSNYFFITAGTGRQYRQKKFLEIFDVTGPHMFTEMLRANDPAMDALIKQVEELSIWVDGELVATISKEQEEVFLKSAPFYFSKIETGSDHSWQ